MGDNSEHSRDNVNLIYFTRELPGISEDLEHAGFQVFEALAISEVLYLAEQHPRAHIVVDHSVDDAAAQEVALHHITLRLTPETTAAEVAWELSQRAGAAIN